MLLFREIFTSKNDYSHFEDSKYSALYYTVYLEV